MSRNQEEGRRRDPLLSSGPPPFLNHSLFFYTVTGQPSMEWDRERQRCMSSAPANRTRAYPLPPLQPSPSAARRVIKKKRSSHNTRLSMSITHMINICLCNPHQLPEKGTHLHQPQHSQKKRVVLMITKRAQRTQADWSLSVFPKEEREERCSPRHNSREEMSLCTSGTSLTFR
jgi:hypothetical protein